MTSLPYAKSTAGQGREKEIRDTLRGVGASAVEFIQVRGALGLFDWRKNLVEKGN